jgi:LysR family hca operon transcriptional activator
LGTALAGGPDYDIVYHVIDQDQLIVLMFRNHRLSERETASLHEFHDEIFIGGSNKAAVLGVVTEPNPRRSGVDIALGDCVDNVAEAMSLVPSTGGLALMPAGTGHWPQHSGNLPDLRRSFR